MEEQQRNRLIEDIKTILKNGGVPVSNLNKQLRGDYCTCIDRMWCVPTNLSRFENLLEELGFAVVSRLSPTKRHVGRSVLTKEQHQEILDLENDVKGYQYNVDKVIHHPALKEASLMKIGELNFRIKNLMGA